MKKNHDLVDLECIVMHETDSAWLIDVDDKQVWIPKSQAELNDEETIITMQEWLAIEKELV